MTETKILCPKCGSDNITANKKGFSGKKAVVGAIATGGIGILAGTIGSNKVKITCLSCGNEFKPGEGANSQEDFLQKKKDNASTSKWAIIILIVLGLIGYLSTKFSETKNEKTETTTSKPYVINSKQLDLLLAISTSQVETKNTNELNIKIDSLIKHTFADNNIEYWNGKVISIDKEKLGIELGSTDVENYKVTLVTDLIKQKKLTKNTELKIDDKLNLSGSFISFDKPEILMTDKSCNTKIKLNLKIDNIEIK
jgi:predicted RNA-binding Zn-ribbon protein involved in translation (DUF1610 family)